MIKSKKKKKTWLNVLEPVTRFLKKGVWKYIWRKRGIKVANIRRRKKKR